MLPRGIRNSNPGNIRHSRTMWQGESAQQFDPQFVTFEAPVWGLRAIVKIMRTYAGRGLRTIRQIVTRWAPPSENDTEAYIESVCANVGAGPDVEIDVGNADVLVAIVKAIVWHENGIQPYPDALIREAIQIA